MVGCPLRPSRPASIAKTWEGSYGGILGNEFSDALLKNYSTQPKYHINIGLSCRKACRHAANQRLYQTCLEQKPAKSPSKSGVTACPCSLSLQIFLKDRTKHGIGDIDHTISFDNPNNHMGHILLIVVPSLRCLALVSAGRPTTRTQLQPPALRVLGPQTP